MLAVLLTEQAVAWPIAVLVCLLTGAVIGVVIGLLVAKLGIPSFVVTLAVFLGLQGVMLYIIGEGGTIPVRNEELLKIMNSNLSPAMGWILVVLIVSGVAALTCWRAPSACRGTARGIARRSSRPRWAPCGCCWPSRRTF